ncbi:TPA: sugar kinase [bacterium]|nr:sugar kinase [bacterium]
MSIVVVGSVALDSVETPSGKVENALGGSATYFSVSASFFTNDIGLVAVVGKDFPKENIDFLKSRGIDLEGLEIAEGKTFHWSGRYGMSLSGAETLSTKLNVFEKFSPKVPEKYKATKYLFLANINPELQMDVLKQIKNAKLVVCDTMNLWISQRREQLLETIKHVDILIINDEEARQLTGEKKVDMSARKILDYGPKRVIIKKGEHGVMTLSDSTYFSAPAYPLKSVFDPTGAGDTFAGGFMGYLASTDEVSETNIRKAMIYGTVMASFNVEDFSLNRQRRLTKDEIESRFAEMRSITEF